MSESATHKELIRLIVEWIGARYSGLDSLSVFSDESGSCSAEKPPNVNGHKPDVYAADSPSTVTIIGEAKTARDLETARTFSQFSSFLTHLQYAKSPLLVVATPFHMRIRAQAIIRQAQEQTGTYSVPVVVIDRISAVSAPAPGDTSAQS